MNGVKVVKHQRLLQISISYNIQMDKQIQSIKVNSKVLPDSQDPPSPTFPSLSSNPTHANPSINNQAGKYGQSQIAFIKQTPKNKLNIQKISLSELSKHNTKQDAWISLRNIVYDVTQYLKHHPGGNILLEGCGKQSQKLFDQHHQWVNAKNILSKWVIGELQQ